MKIGQSGIQNRWQIFYLAWIELHSTIHQRTHKLLYDHLVTKLQMECVVQFLLFMQSNNNKDFLQ